MEGVGTRHIASALNGIAQKWVVPVSHAIDGAIDVNRFLVKVLLHGQVLMCRKDQEQILEGIAHSAKKGQNSMNTSLVVVTFRDSTGADEMLQALQELQSEEFIELLDAVIVTKDFNHNVEIRRPLQAGSGMCS